MRISDWSSDLCSSDLEVDRAPVGDCFTDHKAAAQCVVRIGFEGAIRHLLNAVDVKPEGEELDRRNGVNSQSSLLIGVRLGTRREIAIGADQDLGFPDAEACHISSAVLARTEPIRTEGRRVGTGCVSPCRFGGWPNE